MSEWSTLSLAEVADIRSSNVDKKTLPGEVPVSLCNYMDVYSYEYIRNDHDYMQASATPDEIRRFRVQVGDVMMTKDSEVPSDIGISAVVTEPIESFVCGYHLALLKPNYELVDSVFLAKQLSTDQVKKYFNQVANGSTRYGLTFRAIANTSIPLPPLPQQRRIAEILSTVDDAIEATEALIAKQQQIKQGLMHDLFTRGVWTAESIARAREAGSTAATSAKEGQLRPSRETAPELYKESPLGWIPKDWEVKSLLEFSNRTREGFVNGPFGSDLLTSELQETGVVVIYVQDVKEDRYVRKSKSCVTEHKANELYVCNVKLGDVLITKVGDPPGVAAVYLEEERAIVTQDVIRIRPEKSVNSFYLSALLNFSLSSGRLGKILIEGTRSRFSLTEYKAFLLPYLGVQEQESIGGLLVALLEQSSTLMADLAALQKQKQGLMQDLLTGKVSVQL